VPTTTDVTTDAPTGDSALCCPPLGEGALRPQEAEDLALRLKALADPARLRLLSLLLAAEGGEACTCDLVEPLGLSQPTVSHHLGRLAAAGIVESDRRGRWTWYRVRPDALAALRAVLDPRPVPRRGPAC
jgi:ArsR family transcriptional regulator